MQGPTTVVNICSLACSGSTWLNMLLGAHPQIFGVGEIKTVRRIGRAFCTFHGDECPLWSRYVIDGANPFEQCRDLSGRSILVVNNSRKHLVHQHGPGMRSRFIHLVRDGRAVVASYIRKDPEVNIWQFSAKWVHEMRRNRRLLRRQPAADVLQVHYEHLMHDTRGELQRICQWMGVPFDPRMLEYWNHVEHFLGGNRGTLSMIAGHREAALAPVPPESERVMKTMTEDTGFYKNMDPRDFSDERWKTELSDKQLRIFAITAGWLNRRLGYSRTLDRNASLPRRK